MKKSIIFAALLLAVLLPLGAARAFEVKVDNSIHLNKDQVADGTIYANCQEMIIDGTVNGDIIAICQKIVINGVVSGDLIAFGQNIEINGEIKGSARIAGPQITINGVVGHSVNMIGNDLKLNKTSLVGWDALVLGVNGYFDGNIDGNLHGLVNVASISGKVGRNINLTVDDQNSKAPHSLLITKDAVVAGNINYTATKDLVLENSSSVAGQINKDVRDTKDNSNNWLWSIFYKLSSFILIALVIISFKKESFEKIINKLNTKWWQSLLIGLAVLFLTPLLIIILMITVVGIPLALILLATYLSSIIISIVLSSYYLGELALRKSSKTIKPNVYGAAILGLAIFTVLSIIPGFGILVSFVAIISGLGSMFLIIKDKQND